MFWEGLICERKGFTHIELATILAVLAVLFGIVAADVRPPQPDARTAATEFASVMRLARSRAMRTTSAHRVVVVTDATSVRVEAASACNDPEVDREAEAALAKSFATA